MLSIYQLPKQTRALDAIKRLKSYFEIQGNADKEPLPTMSKIVDYCIKYPRLLRIRDSPLKVLHDPSLPYVVVHDWYIGIALDYLEASVVVLLEQWEKNYKKKRYNSQQVFNHFIPLVNDIYECYEHTGLALNMPFPEGSPLGAVELKEKMKYASIALIKEKITHFFTDTRDLFYTQGLKTIELLFRANLKEKMSFSYLFSPDIAKYKNENLEHYAQTILDTDLPGLVDVFNLSDEMLKDACNQSFNNDKKHEDIEIDTWFVPDEEEDHLSVEDHESHLQEFSIICDKLNGLGLAPNWIAILIDTIKARLNSSPWKDEWEISMVSVQLKWLHVLILPWISYVIPKTEDINANWNEFLRQKIKAEHVLYEYIYKARISNIYNIIRDYPSTKEAILDFHITATKRGLLDNLKEELIQALQTRLLHQGASSTDILQQYISCVQCLSIIDPSCSIMAPIIELIESYVKQYRNDIIDGVVKLIRNQDIDALPSVEEEFVYVFQQSELTHEETSRESVVIKEDEPAMLRKLQYKSRDPVAMLISMCNPLQHFVKRYGDKLGEALFQIKDYNTDAEVQKLEILKKNFPDDTFTRCDVMLRDIDNSKRLDRTIHEDPEIKDSFHAIMFSKSYWPSMNEDDNDDLEEPFTDVNPSLWPEYEGVTERYAAAYKKAKASRRLNFLRDTGSVTLELEFETRTVKFDTSLEAASIISLFETKEKCFTLNEIAQKLKLSREKVVKALEFWVENEVIELLADGKYVLLEE